LPLYLRMRLGDRSMNHYLLIYGNSDSPGQHTDRWLWPLWSHTRHTAPDWTDDRFLWVIGRRRRGDGLRVTALYPLYAHRVESGRDWTSWLWPLIHARSDQTESGRRYQRQFVIPLYFHQKWTGADGALLKELRSLIPLWRSVRREDGSSELSWPHLWWYAENEAVARNWAPLWTLYERRDDGHGTVERRVFWRLWRSRTIEAPGEASADGESIRRTDWEFNFLIGRLSRPPSGPNRLSLLGLEFPLGRAGR
jgi:hypothetical protein